MRLARRSQRAAFAVQQLVHLLDRRDALGAEVAPAQARRR
jgi:hypothetical protein